MPASTGMDRHTGKRLSDWPHVKQSIEVLFSTGYGSRVMRRYVGSGVPKLLGSNLTERTALRFVAAVVTALEAVNPKTGLAMEPRFKVTRVDLDPEANSPEQLRSGRLRMALRGEYRPRGHLGDPTPARGEVSLVLGAVDGNVMVV